MLKSSLTRTLAVAAMGITAVLGGGASVATAAPAPAELAATVAVEPVYEAFTVLNGGKNLASNSSGIAVASPGQTNDRRQQWERRVAGNVAPKVGFSKPYQIRNSFTGLCLRDVGDGFPAVEQECETNLTSKSPQLWHEHVAVDRTVNGLPFRFQFNRATGRVLSQAPEFGTAVPVLSSPKATNDLSAAAALQLWWIRPASLT